MGIPKNTDPRSEEPTSDRVHGLPTDRPSNYHYGSPTDHPEHKIKKKKIEFSLTGCLIASISWANFRTLRWENVTDLQGFQTFQPSRFNRETHGLGWQLTVTVQQLTVK